jgi:hypothetical protein
MDTIVTLEGRRQIADGKLRVEYVSFTDSAAFYEADAVSGSTDASSRLYFEQCNLPQDQITFEADDSGKLKPFKSSNEFNLLAGNIYTQSTGSIVYTGSSFTKTDYEYLTDARFMSAAESMLASSVDNFKKLYTLGTKDVLFLEEENMNLSRESVEFTILQKPAKPLGPERFKTQLSALPSIFHDKLFSKSKNFKYLPPINKIDDKGVDKKNKDIIAKNSIGNYENFSENENYSFEDLIDELKIISDAGYKQTVRFDATSLNNKLVSQFFEITQQDMMKLDILDFGIFKHENSLKHVFFVGKIMTDDNQTDTFIRMFTLIFE